MMRQRLDSGPDNGSYASRSKQTPYEGGIRTPIMYRWPGMIPVADRNELASSIDIMPTLLSAAGADLPEGLPGLNLIPSLIDEWYPVPIGQ